MNKISLIASGFLLGTAGLHILASRDAKKVYAHCTAATLRAAGDVMKCVTKVREDACDVYADAKEINARREAEANAVIEDAAE